MTPESERLIMYGEPAEGTPIDWAWVDSELTRAGVYWIVAVDGDRAHTRPVWGVWRGHELFLSIGSPKVNDAIAPGSPVTVHLGGDVDVVIVEGHILGSSDDSAALREYDAKYDWDYSVDVYGPFTVVQPDKVMDWRSAGEAGRDGFQAAGKWRFGN
jgi:hypothetical protein